MLLSVYSIINLSVCCMLFTVSDTYLILMRLWPRMAFVELSLAVVFVLMLGYFDNMCIMVSYQPSTITFVLLLLFISFIIN